MRFIDFNGERLGYYALGVAIGNISILADLFALYINLNCPTIVLIFIPLAISAGFPYAHHWIQRFINKKGVS